MTDHRPLDIHRSNRALVATKPTRRLGLALGLGLALLGGCSSEETVRGFVLPEGDIDRGRAAFVELECQQCHVVEDDALPAWEGEQRYQVRLGGEVLKVQDYGDLLTAVVLPSHRLSQKNVVKAADGAVPEESPMPNLTETMTVAQLLDMVSYLHGMYSQRPSYGGYQYVR